MTDIEAEDQAGEGKAGEDAAAEAESGSESGADGGDAAAERADDASGDDSQPEDEAESDAEEDGGEQATVSPEERLEALQEDIDAVRRRVAEDSVDQGDEAFVQEGEASEDEPVDDTIAPPG